MKICFIDTNPEIIKALSEVFSPAEAYPDVVISKQPITAYQADIYVTPTNATGRMSGGVDLALKTKFGVGLEQRLRLEIELQPKQRLNVGRAVVVQLIPGENRFLVAAATMAGEQDNISRTVNTARACAAAFQAIYTAVDRGSTALNTVAIPGLGGGTGGVPPRKVAELLHLGYTLFRRRRYATWEELAAAVDAELDVSAKPQPTPAPTQIAVVASEPADPMLSTCVPT